MEPEQAMLNLKKLRKAQAQKKSYVITEKKRGRGGINSKEKARKIH